MKQNYPFSFSMNKTGLPLIVVSMYNKNICFLIDTGSTINLLNNQVYDHFKDKIPIVSDAELIGIDGTKQSVERVIVDFTFEDKVYSSSFTIFDATLAFKQIEVDSGIQIHGILGNEFLIENEWVIDYEHLQIKYN